MKIKLCPVLHPPMGSSGNSFQSSTPRTPPQQQPGEMSPLRSCNRGTSMRRMDGRDWPGTAQRAEAGVRAGGTHTGCERTFYKPASCKELQLLTFAPGFSVWLLFIYLFCFCYTGSIVLEIKGLKNEQMTQPVISTEHNLKSKGQGCHSTDCVVCCQAGGRQPYPCCPQAHVQGHAGSEACPQQCGSPEPIWGPRAPHTDQSTLRFLPGLPW